MTKATLAKQSRRDAGRIRGSLSSPTATGRDGLRFPAMTKQRAIAASDHRAGVPEQGLGGVACGGCLPIVALEAANAEHDLRDFLLRGSGAMTVECLQHPAQSRALLPRQAGVGRYGSAVQCGEQAGDGLKPIEAFEAEWDEGGERLGSSRSRRVDQPYSLAIPQIENRIGLVVSVDADRGVDNWVLISICAKNIGRCAEDDGACIVLGKPDHPRFGRSQQWVHGEIATPTAVRSFR